MKKKLLVTALIATMVLSMTACGEKGTSESGSVAMNNSETQTATDATAELVAESVVESTTESTENKKDYWILQQDFGTPSTSFEGTLFNDQVVLPLELSAIDTYAAPYLWFPNGVNATRNETINEILTSDIMLKYRDGNTRIRPQASSKETGKEEISQFDEGYCGIGSIYIDNFSVDEEELPLSTCYENGWWCIYANENGNHARFLQVEEGTDAKKIASDALKKFGTPTYIANVFEEYSSLDEWFASMAEDDTVDYNLIYEYDDFTLEIWIMEVGVGKNYVFKISSTAYYPSTYWALKKETYKTLLPIE